MKEPEVPENEAQRHKSLCELEILDSSPEARFDRITRVAICHFNVPIALVSLVDSERQWFKSRQGLDASETPRNISFCGHAILDDGIFYVPDTLNDARFSDNPLVTAAPKIRFYAGAPLRAPDGQRVGTLCIIDSQPRIFSADELSVLRDLADCVEAELERGHLLLAKAELVNSEARISAIVETVVDGIITIDSDGMIHTFNPAAEKVFGFTENEVVGKNVTMLVPEPYRSEATEYLLNYFSTGDKKAMGIGHEVVGQRKDGSTFPMELAASEMEVNGEYMFTGIVRDITERMRLDRMKDEFISTVSHELRTPLTSICGALGLVLGKLPESLPDSLRQMLEMAERNSHRLTLLINDLLDLEKLESDHLEFDLTRLDLIQVAQRAVEENEAFAYKHGVKLRMKTALTAALIDGDEYRLLQVFANLISNAVKFSPKDEVVEVSIESLADGFRVMVRDRGVGVPLEFANRIFERFAQADASDTRAKGGTGLGLSITQAIVERHEGYVGYESEPGKGALFYFDLPRGLPAVQPVFKEHRENEVDTRVLICEDNPDVAIILSAMLKTEGLLSDIATTAGGARSLLAKHHYCLMLLDLVLPDVCGLTFLDEIRKVPATAELPVIVVSGRAEEGRMNFTGDSIRVVDWLQKPLDRKRLGKALSDALRNNQRPHILHIEYDLDIIQIVQALVEDVASLSYVTTLQEAKKILVTQRFDLAILDIGLADGSGLDLLDQLKEHCPVIIFSGQLPDCDITNEVAAALPKSMTSNEHLLATIKKSLGDC